MGATKLQLPLFAPPASPAERSPLAEHNDVEYVPMMCRSILNWVDGAHMQRTFSINPYRGCEVGCAYCYARYTHEFLDLPNWEAFEQRVFVKVDAPAALRRELLRKEVLEHGIAIGTATDPYQPAERHFRITRQLLEALCDLPVRGVPISIVTKSNLIRRDAKLLARVAERHDLTVCFSCITCNVDLLRVLEHRAPHPDARFSAMRTLVSHGVRCGLLVAPILPGITDGEANLEEVVARAQRAGASFVHTRLLFLTDASKRRFFPWLREHAPALFDRYQAAYGKRMYARTEYQRHIDERVQRVLGAHGFSSDE